MADKMNNTTSVAELRRKAEEKVASQLAFATSSQETDTKRLLHELQVHQVELEMQNEELRLAIVEKSEHEAHLRNIITQTPAGYFHIDLEGRFLNVNKAWLRMHGYDSPDEVIGKHFSMMQVDSESDSALIHLAELQRGVAIPYGEFSSRRKDGSVGHHIFSAHPVVNVSTIVGFEWFIIDISERIKAEETLRRKKDMLARTEKITHVGSWEWDVATDTVLWSEELFRIHQLNPADGAPSFAEQSKLYHPEDMTELKRVVGIALSEGTPYEIEIRVIRRDGETRNCLAMGLAESDSEGRIARLFGALRDLTEFKQAENELLLAKVAADSANIAKSQFLANMSHELRNPMNGVLGMTQLLEMTELTEEQLEYVTDLNMCGKNLLSLINDILDLSKIEAGKITIEPVEFSLNHCINDVVRLQKTLVLGKGLKLDLDVSEDIPQFMMGDQLRVKQILHNLIGNAIKFTSQGGITISAQLLEKRASSLLVQLAVRDSGIGISPGNLDKIFMPFEQEDGSTTRNYGGTGLGLTISRRLVELMGGSITVESTPGSGCCFKVNLPFSEIEESATTQNAPQKATVSWDGPPLRILLVENDQVNITFGTSLLKKLGHEVIVAENGRECLAVLENGGFDIVLMDINMPDMNGKDALREIRKKEQETDLHQMVMALTAYSLRGDKEKFLEEGFDGYVSKPMAVSQLVCEMKRVLEKNHD